MRTRFAVVVALVLLTAACGDDQPEAGSSSTEPAGPETTSTVLDATSAAVAELEDAVVRAAASECATHDTVAGLLAGVPGDLRVEDLGIVAETTLDGEPTTRISSGVLSAEWAGVFPTAFTVADGVVGRTHVLLYLNHHRTVAALAAFLNRPLAVEVLSRPEPSSTDPDVVLAGWDGRVLAFTGDEEPIPTTAFTFMPAPDAALAVSGEALTAGWDRAGRWAAALAEITRDGEFDRTADLEPFAADLAAARALFCVLYSTEWQLAQDTLDRHTDDPEWPAGHPEVFSPELAIGELLLVTEYVAAVAALYDAPEVDWLRAAGDHALVDPFDGVTSTAEYAGMWTFGLDDALTRFRMWIELGGVPFQEE